MIIITNESNGNLEIWSCFKREKSTPGASFGTLKKFSSVLSLFPEEFKLNASGHTGALTMVRMRYTGLLNGLGVFMYFKNTVMMMKCRLILPSSKMTYHFRQIQPIFFCFYLLFQVKLAYTSHFSIIEAG